MGSCAAFAMQMSGKAREIALLDANEKAAEGEALDMLHGAAFTADQKIYSTDYAGIADSDIVVITAGLRRKPDESRLDLINRNVSLFRTILESLKQSGLRRDAIIFVVSNPVDILTYLAYKELDWPVAQVIGLGNVLDTTRFCSLISSELDLPATQVRAMILGEHGDTMTPIWSAATLDGFPLSSFPGCDINFQNRIFERTKKSGAEVISRKGGAGWGVGVSISEVVDSIILDRQRVLPVSGLVNGLYNIRDVSLSVPTVVGRGGIVKQVEIDLWPKELNGLQASARALKDILGKV